MDQLVKQLRDASYSFGNILFEEAADEIKRLRAVVRAADRLHSDTLYRWAPESKDYYMEMRATVELPSVSAEGKHD